MQIAKFVGHRPRPPSSSGVPLSLSFPLFPFLFIGRSGIAAGTRLPRTTKLQSKRLECRLPAPIAGAEAGSGVWNSNSVGAALPGCS
jgi:hypothetical protein